jgi:hypothetical protein
VANAGASICGEHREVAEVPVVTVDQSSPTTVRTLQLADSYLTNLSISRNGIGRDEPSDSVTFLPSEVTCTIGAETAACDFVEARVP